MLALPRVFTVADALRHGLTRHQVATRVRRGEWLRLRRGVYCLAATWEAADVRGRHLLHCAAAQSGAAAGAVLSHLSAAAAWGFPLPLDGLTDVWLTTPPEPHGCTRRRHGLVLDVAALPAPDVERRNDLLVTAPARTVADCLRRADPGEAVAVADAALREGLPAEALRRSLDAQAGWPFAARAQLAALLVDPRRESWLESSSVVRLHERGIPLPEPQVTVLDERRRAVARPDWCWSEHGVLGEADGREKYRRQGLRTVADVDRLMRIEKDREDALRDLGWQVVRYGTRDVQRDLDGLVARIHRAFRRGDPSRLRGSLRRAPGARPFAP